MKNKRKIFVGISGGVDSSVAAYLLKKQGHDVHGVFVKTWSPDWLPCTWVDEKRDAMRVCAALDIPFHFVDAEQAYKDGVADYMISEYRAGRTPNPDVLCNRVIKFGVMWDYVLSQGGEAVATGHYAQIKEGSITQAVDTAKDQSYFLWMLKKADIEHTIFPIGHMLKSEVRDIAKKAGLFTGEKKDSQGICFLGDVDMKDFLSHYIEQHEGDIENEDGEVIGRHDGVWFYTLGERHGFRINKQSTEQKPYFVIRKDIDSNKLIVSTERVANTTGKTQRIDLRDVRIDTTQTNLSAQVRYHGSMIPAVFESPNKVTLSTSEPIACGQSLVLFDKEKLVGGGVIGSVS